MQKKFARLIISALVLASTVAACENYIEPLSDSTRPIELYLLNYLPLLVLYLLLLAATNRTILASFLSSSAALSLAIINNIKYDVLQNTLIPLDFLLIPQIIESPKLYLKYISPSAYLYASVFLLVTTLLFRFESGLFHLAKKLTLARMMILVVGIVFFSGITSANSIISKIYRNNSSEFACWLPQTSVKSSGLFYTLIRMSVELDFKIPDNFGDPSLIQNAIKTSKQHPVAPQPTGLPDIIVIQSESFYDLRQHTLKLDDSAYAVYDKTTKKAAISGNLIVPTLGGNTVKTEFSFLTGIEGSVLPAGCEYPYRVLVKDNIWSIAWYLKTLGYKTIALHPHSRTFWDRNVALPFLGFDEFIDGRYFSDAQLDGPYVSDEAIAKRIDVLRQRLKAPLFIFAITMENHGPWDRNRLTKFKEFSIGGNINPDDRLKFTQYLHHISNAGTMASEVTRNAAQKARPCIVTFFGDHAPGFTGTLAKFPLKPGKSIMNTPYFIWRNFGKNHHTSQDVSVDFLASLVLDEAGINSDPYFMANSFMRKTSNGSIKNLDPLGALEKSYTQLLYNNLIGKLENITFLAKQDILSELQSASNITLQIKDYGPKILKAGVGGNIQHDGSTAVWLTGNNLSQSYIIYANDIPLKTSLSVGATAITAVLPTHYYEEKGTIDLHVEDSNTLNTSNVLPISVND